MKQAERKSASILNSKRRSGKSSHADLTLLNADGSVFHVHRVIRPRRCGSDNGTR